MSGAMPPLALAEEAIRRAEGVYRPLVSQVKDYAIFSTDASGRVATWNEGCRVVLGYEEHEFVGMESSLLFTPEDRTQGVPERELSEARATGHAVSDHWMLAKDRRFFAGGVTTAVRDPGGSLMGFTIVMRDHTRWKQAEDMLRCREERYFGLFNRIDTGFCIVEMIFDREGRPVDYAFLETNAAFERHTGLTEAVGKTIREMVPGHDESWFEIYGEVAVTGRPRRFENLAKAMGRWYDVFAFPVDENDAPGHYHVGVLFTDISDRKRSDDAQRAAREELDRFAAVAGHDLREPMRSVSLLAQFVLQDEPNLSPQGRERLEQAVKLCGRLNEMVSGLLEYARAGAPADMALCDLSSVVGRVVESLAPSLRERGGEVRVGPGLPTVRGDCMQLDRLFANLITNGVRHNASPVKRVDVGFEGGEVFVRDNGAGIDPKDQERIFQPFQRLATGGRDSAGAGLGLAVVKRVMERHGGSVRVDSRVGHGSTFYLRFPPP